MRNYLISSLVLLVIGVMEFFRFDSLVTGICSFYCLFLSLVLFRVWAGIRQEQIQMDIENDYYEQYQHQ